MALRWPASPWIWPKGEQASIIDQAFQEYGRIDTLVNNAGVSRAKPFWDLTEEDWDSVLDVNVKALFFALQAAAKYMLPHGGSIINIASVAGRLPRPTLCTMRPARRPSSPLPGLPLWRSLATTYA